MKAENGSSPTGKAAQQSHVRGARSAKAQQLHSPMELAPVAEVAEPAEALMTADEVAVLLRITRKAVYARSDRGQFPKIKIGGSVRFCRSDLLAFIAAGRAPSPRSSR